jgi:tRNA A-37 threonylcarbamoyl transferase component Bud32
VVRVSRARGDDLILKQARGQLNVAEPWFCSVKRVWREIDVLRECERLLSHDQADGDFQVETPRFLFEDRENYLYAMSAAPADHIVWKSELLAGVARRDVAAACGRLLGRLHAGSWNDAGLARRLDDRTFFDDLRLDPYYRQVAKVHSELAPALEQLIADVWRERHCLVHGDFSPKNLLVYDRRLILIDFEVGHYGDPAFDLGFFLTHLLLKTFYHVPRHEPYFELTDSFWASYRKEMAQAVSPRDFDALVGRGILNLAGCSLARLDGKSRIEYLNDNSRRDAVRELCRQIFATRPHQWSDVRNLASSTIANLRKDS